jgi:hypothetical protein
VISVTDSTRRILTYLGDGVVYFPTALNQRIHLNPATDHNLGGRVPILDTNYAILVRPDQGYGGDHPRPVAEIIPYSLRAFQDSFAGTQNINPLRITSSSYVFRGGGARLLPRKHLRCPQARR